MLGEPNDAVQALCRVWEASARKAAQEGGADLGALAESLIRTGAKLWSEVVGREVFAAEVGLVLAATLGLEFIDCTQLGWGGEDDRPEAHKGEAEGR
jgi:hypothetical protein